MAQVSDAMQTKWWLKISKMDEAARLFLHSMLRNQCTILAMFFLDVFLTLFQKHSPLGKHSAGDMSTQKDWQSYEKLKMES